MYEFVAGDGERRREVKWVTFLMLFVVCAMSKGRKERAVQKHEQLRKRDALCTIYIGKGRYRHGFLGGTGGGREGNVCKD